jgi:AhpD family alkylhydroperoxidase
MYEGSKMSERFKEAAELMDALQKDYPHLIGPFAVYMRKAESDGALPSKTKELISVALSVSSRCEWCIAFHVRAALDAGASKDEIMEACFVAVLMAGGPALMYTQHALKEIDAYQNKKQRGK